MNVSKPNELKVISNIIYKFYKDIKFSYVFFFDWN